MFPSTLTDFAITLSLIIVYFIAVIWIPEMTLVWGITLFSLYLGTALFDNLDLMRMGLDISATRFFEKENLDKSKKQQN